MKEKNLAHFVIYFRTKMAQEIHNASGFFPPVIDGQGGVIPDRLDLLAAVRPAIPILIGNVHDEHFGDSKFLKIISTIL